MEPTLPILVVEMVIDQIDAESAPGTLAACALICKDLTPRSRLGLYQTLYITSFHRLNALGRVLERVPAVLYLVRAVQVNLCCAYPWRSDNALHNLAPAKLLPHLSYRTCAWRFVGRGFVSETEVNNDPPPLHSDAVGLSGPPGGFAIEHRWFRAETLIVLGQYSSISELSLSHLVFRSLNDCVGVILACGGLRVLGLGPVLKIHRVASRLPDVTQRRLARTFKQITELRVSVLL